MRKFSSSASVVFNSFKLNSSQVDSMTYGFSFRLLSDIWTHVCVITFRIKCVTESFERKNFSDRVISVWCTLHDDVHFTSLTRLRRSVYKSISSNGFSSHIISSCSTSASYQVHSFMCFMCILHSVFCPQLLY